jgi:hypothetical protein
MISTYGGEFTITCTWHQFLFTILGEIKSSS